MDRLSGLVKPAAPPRKTISIRVPPDLDQRYEGLKARLKAKGQKIAITDIVTAAMDKAINEINAELDQLEKEKQNGPT